MCQLLSLFARDIPVLEIDLVGKQRDDYSISSLVLHIIDPLLNAVEGIPVGHIVNDNCH